MTTKAVALLSGGLDSTIAVKMLIDQGIHVTCLNFVSAFCTCDATKKTGKHDAATCKSAAHKVSEDFGVPIKVMAKGMDYIEVLKAPKYGYGAGMNPCVDCRIYMFTKAKEYMKEIGASFIMTGEVLGQRPMSQRLDTFEAMDKDSGLEGLVLRPLCAQHLEPTIPEKTGLVDREKLLSIVGRSRKPQIQMAKDMKIEDYPCPSGGCLLTEKQFSKKVKDLFDTKEDITNTDIHLLKSGRHFRYNDTKVVVGRDEEDNFKLARLLQEGDTLVEPVDFPGPSALVSGELTNGLHEFVGGLLVRYANKKSDGKGTLKATVGDESKEFTVDAPIEESVLRSAIIC